MVIAYDFESGRLSLNPECGAIYNKLRLRSLHRAYPIEPLSLRGSTLDDDDDDNDGEYGTDDDVDGDGDLMRLNNNNNLVR